MVIMSVNRYVGLPGWLNSYILHIYDDVIDIWNVSVRALKYYLCTGSCLQMPSGNHNISKKAGISVFLSGYF